MYLSGFHYSFIKIHQPNQLQTMYECNASSVEQYSPIVKWNIKGKEFNLLQHKNNLLSPNESAFISIDFM